MGKCFTKHESKQSIIPSMQSKQVSKPQRQSTQTVSSTESNQTGHPYGRIAKYWHRRICKISGNSQSLAFQVSRDHINKFFDYAKFDQKTSKYFYDFLKLKRTNFNSKLFVLRLIQISRFNQEKVSEMLYFMLFNRSHKQIDLGKFKSDYNLFAVFHRTSSSDDYNQPSFSSTKYFENKIRQLSTILAKRTSLSDSKFTIKWLAYNINCIKYKQFLVEEPLRLDQIDAFKQVCLDIMQSKISKSEIKAKQKQKVYVVNMRWFQNMVNYMESKYKLCSRQLETVYIQPLSNKLSWFVKFPLGSSNINNTPSKSKLHIFFQLENSGQPVPVKTSVVISSKYNYQSIQVRENQIINSIAQQPEQIDNDSMIGDFEWQLKKGLRKNLDYVVLKAQTFEKLTIVFGLKNSFYRMQSFGHCEIRPYFIKPFLYSFQTVSKTNQLKEEDLIQISINIDTKSFSDIINKFSEAISNPVIYLRSIGGSWQRFDLPLSITFKFNMNFQEFTFLVYMNEEMEENFKKYYLFSNLFPEIGEVYQSLPDPIIEKVEQKRQRNQPFRACIVNVEEKKNVKLATVTFVGLNRPQHIKRTISFKTFHQNFNYMSNYRQMVNPKTRGGFYNLGNTCYLSGTLQALFSVLEKAQIQTLNGQLGLQMKQLYKFVTEKKKSVSPINLKLIFEKKFPTFRGPHQKDSHQFLLLLMQKLKQSSNEQLLQKFNIKYKSSNKCTICNKWTEKNTDRNYVLSLPLKDYYMNQSKIYYITKNKNIRTVNLLIDNDCTVAQWRDLFEQTVGGSNFYLCEIENMRIRRNFNKENDLGDKRLKDLSLSFYNQIVAYQTKLYEGETQFRKGKHNYCTFLDQKGRCHVARVESSAKQDEEVEEMFGFSIIQQQKNKTKITVPVNYWYQQLYVPSNQLRRFPSQFKAESVFIKINNYSGTQKQRIRRPFLFQIMNNQPLQALKNALEECIGQSGYIFQIRPINQYIQCNTCRNYDKCLSYLMQELSSQPICWVLNAFEFFLIWNDSDQIQRMKFNILEELQYQASFINREAFLHNTQSVDFFQQSLSRYQQKEKVLGWCSKLEHEELLSNNWCKETKTDEDQKQKVQILIQNEVFQWPQKLIIHLSRFRERGNQLIKNTIKWKLEGILQINGKNYQLQAVLCHRGSPDWGYYYTVSYGVCYNDEIITKMKYEDIPEEDIYMLIYRAKEQNTKA